MEHDDPRLRATMPQRQVATPAPDADAAGARLVFVDGPRRGDIIALGDAPAGLGRQLDNDIVIESERVSRRHARIERRDGGAFTLTDLGSVNGTAVNGERLEANEPRRLRDRDVLQLPAATLIFLHGVARTTGEARRPDLRRLETIHLDQERIRAEADAAIRDFLAGGGRAPSGDA
jgi:predicted component of type VI protein secretion system